jgi:hypothetical protein
MASETTICNRALQILGAQRITSLTENSVNGRACSAAYESVRDALTRAHRWRCSITRVAVAADASAPAFGKDYSYTLPVDCLAVLPPYPDMDTNDRDWEVEGRKIYTNESAPLSLRYSKQMTDPNEMDPLFREALSAKLAVELCEQITQSNTKKEDARTAFKDAMAEARHANGIESLPAESPEDSWISVRNE